MKINKTEGWFTKKMKNTRISCKADQDKDKTEKTNTKNDRSTSVQILETLKGW